ncbi:ribosome assembly RNA-binding protein YhbY [Loigolactobacillus iwatensis]|uniref:ribosome assembly RNA-binding protein YhbY n=1 Tax=Loigolactobacillus iwatensis TaxID=1267156 RepID=UPI000F7D7B6B|nr:ribosome assembly RNA-binding protein YhbY [Loigolactobacillus iwatensis]
MTLTGKQKRFLRARANRLRPVFQVGKNGLTATFIRQIDESLERNELIKINLLQNTTVSAKEVATVLTEALPKLVVAQIIGHVLVLYRPAEKEKYQRISAQVAAL